MTTLSSKSFSPVFKLIIAQKLQQLLRMNSDASCCTALVLLDLSAAFDTVDHRILINRLENCIGVTGTALDWFKSYLSDRTFSVSVGNVFSSYATITCGIPQGSILGPLLFSIYMLSLGRVIHNSNISFHFYVDNTQIYLSINPSDLTSFTSLTACLADIRSWMSNNFLMLNNDKSKVMVFGPKAHRDCVSQTLAI